MLVLVEAMKEKRLILSVTITLLVLLIFSISYILLSTNTSIASIINGKNNQSNIIDNSTMSTNLIDVSFEGQTLFWNFFN
jgi:hypothetical protein